jgi:hypothetical protein
MNEPQTPTPQDCAALVSQAQAAYSGAPAHVKALAGPVIVPMLAAMEALALHVGGEN